MSSPPVLPHSRRRIAAPPAPSPEPAPRRELPRPRSSFVGREADLAAIRRLVEEGAQLVTLLGPPGIGKTRLSLHAARALGGDATFCELSEARDEAALLTAAALSLGVSVEAPMSSEALSALVGRALAQRGEALFVLDNVEQIAAVAAAAVGRWMDAAPAVVFLVTSRERLRITGEHALLLGPLDVPSPRETSTARILASEGVTLLVDRARATRSGFRASPAEVSSLAEIVRRVQGVPLAIELCAARLGMLDARQLLARLDQRLDLLAADPRWAPLRQATLRGAIDGSWDLLDPAERSTFAQCAVFRGGFELDAAEAILQPAPPPSRRSSALVLDALSALFDKSLLAVDEPGDECAVKRYRLYESIRAYAAEKLDDLQLAEGTRDRHARWFAEAGARWAASARGLGFQEGLSLLGRESDNLLAAREWSMDRDELGRALELTLCLEPLAIVRGPVLPYLELLSATLSRGGDRLPPALAARGFGSLGVAESRRGRPAEAVAAFRRAISLASSSGDERQLPFFLAKLANQLCVLGDQAAAEGAFQRAQALLDAREDPAVRGIFCRHHAFFLWRAGRVEEARRQGEEARALLQAHGDRRELAYVLCDLAASYLDEGDLDAVTSALDDALDLLRRLQYRRVESRCLLLFALARRERADLAGARADLDRALGLHAEDGDRGAEGFVLWHQACLALEADEAEPARALGEKALGRYQEIGDGHLVAHARMVLGAALARLGQVDAAQREMESAAALLVAGPAPAQQALTLFQAQVSLARGDRREAERVLAAVDPRTPAAHVRFARRVLAGALGGSADLRREPALPPPAQAALVIREDGRWFRLAEQREVSLERRAALHRILAALGRLRVDAPGRALSLDQVLEAGWPGERVSVEAGTARVYNAIQRLRRLGLEGALRTRDDGYLLDEQLETRMLGRAPRSTEP